MKDWNQILESLYGAVCGLLKALSEPAELGKARHKPHGARLNIAVTL